MLTPESITLSTGIKINSINNNQSKNEDMDIQDYSRGRNNANSKLAFKKIKDTIPAMWEKVLNEVDGIRSTTEIANILRVPIHTISGRFSELKSKQKIYQTSSKKIGSKSYAVYTKTIN